MSTTHPRCIHPVPLSQTSLQPQPNPTPQGREHGGSGHSDALTGGGILTGAPTDTSASRQLRYTVMVRSDSVSTSALVRAYQTAIAQVRAACVWRFVRCGVRLRSAPCAAGRREGERVRVAGGRWGGGQGGEAERGVWDQAHPRAEGVSALGPAWRHGCWSDDDAFPFLHACVGCVSRPRSTSAPLRPAARRTWAAPMKRSRCAPRACGCGQVPSGAAALLGVAAGWTEGEGEAPYHGQIKLAADARVGSAPCLGALRAGSHLITGASHLPPNHPPLCPAFSPLSTPALPPVR